MIDRIRIIKHEAVPGCGSRTVAKACSSIGTTYRSAGLGGI
jgi:hypothetical protein